MLQAWGSTSSQGLICFASHPPPSPFLVSPFLRIFSSLVISPLFSYSSPSRFPLEVDFSPFLGAVRLRRAVELGLVAPGVGSADRHACLPLGLG